MRSHILESMCKNLVFDTSSIKRVDKYVVKRDADIIDGKRARDVKFRSTYTSAKLPN